MALEKGTLLFRKGESKSLPSTKVNGTLYFTIDDGLLRIDYKDSGGALQRKIINANDAATLTGAKLVHALSNSKTEIPSNYLLTSVKSELSNSLGNKMDKVNPTGSGYFSLNRKAGTTIGTNSIAIGTATQATQNSQMAIGKYNKDDTSAAFIIGNGTSSTASNAFTVDWDGNTSISGSYVEFKQEAQVVYDSSKKAFNFVFS